MPSAPTSKVEGGGWEMAEVQLPSPKEARIEVRDFG